MPHRKEDTQLVSQSRFDSCDRPLAANIYRRRGTCLFMDTAPRVELTFMSYFQLCTVTSYSDYTLPIYVARWNEHRPAGSTTLGMPAGCTLI